MMRTMSRTGESIGRLDIAIAVALSALGLLLMYGNATDAEVDASWLAIPVFLGVTIPRAVAPGGSAAGDGRRGRRASPCTSRCSDRSCAAAWSSRSSACSSSRSPRASSARRALWALAGGLAIIVGMAAADETGFGVVRCSCR